MATGEDSIVIRLNSAAASALRWASSVSGVTAEALAKSLLVMQLKSLSDWDGICSERQSREGDKQSDSGSACAQEATERPSMDESGMTKRLAVSVEEAARLMDVSVPTMRRLVGTGEVPSFKFGGSRRIPLRDLEELMAKGVEVEAAKKKDDADLQAG